MDREPQDRIVNLVGAAGVLVSDRIRAATEHAAGRGASVPAALAVMTRSRSRSIEYVRRATGLSQPAAVRLIDGLEADGLVERRPGDDRRTVAPALTASGHAIADGILAAREAALAELLEPLTTRERVTLGRLLEKVLDHAVRDLPEGSHTCRLCDVDACEAGGECPVDRRLGLLDRPST
jgi:DNA-binding MarR family transcriptional regulator